MNACFVPNYDLERPPKKGQMIFSDPSCNKPLPSYFKKARVQVEVGAISMKPIFSILIIVSCLVLLLYRWDIYQDRRNQIIISAPIDLFETPPQNYPKQDRTIETLLPKTSVQVLRISYGKDFQTVKVKASSGKVGWIITDGKSAQLVRIK